MTPDAILDFILMPDNFKKNQNHPWIYVYFFKQLQSFAIVLEKAMNDLILSAPQNLQPYWSIAKYSTFKSLYRFSNLKKPILLD